MDPFFQSPPVLKNCYTDDVLLPALLKRHLPPAVFAEVDADLTRVREQLKYCHVPDAKCLPHLSPSPGATQFGERCAFELKDMSDRMEQEKRESVASARQKITCTLQTHVWSYVCHSIPEAVRRLGQASR